MKSLIYLRPLVLADAQISYRWRNDPEVWQYTEFQPNRYISPEMETEWLHEKLIKINEKRFAICTLDDNQYIGNVQFLDIDKKKASFHIFIGEKSYWGQGISQRATRIVLYYAFSEMGLKEVVLAVNPLNIAASRVYEKFNFEPTGINKKNGFIEMKLSREAFKL